MATVYQRPEHAEFKRPILAAEHARSPPHFRNGACPPTIGCTLVPGERSSDRLRLLSGIADTAWRGLERLSFFVASVQSFPGGWRLEGEML